MKVVGNIGAHRTLWSESRDMILHTQHSIQALLSTENLVGVTNNGDYINCYKSARTYYK